jgi:signal transduction histidine kinase
MATTIETRGGGERALARAGAGARPAAGDPGRGDASPRRRILIVDDSPEDRELYRRLLKSLGGEWALVEAGSGDEGLERAAAERPDCILLDYQLPDVDGLEFLDALGRRGRNHVPVVMVTGQGSEDVAASAVKGGAHEYLVKGKVTRDSLERALRSAIRQAALQCELEDKRRALELSNRELHRRNDAIRRFHHTLSHELRSPLTAAREFALLLIDGLEGPLTPAQHRDIEAVKEACDQMAVYVDDLIDATRLETGKLHVEPVPIALAEPVRRAVVPAYRAAAERGLRLVDRVPPDLPPVLADEVRIAQVLTNLLNNALKFTPKGGEIAIEAAPRPADGLVVVSVSDTGRGIAPAELARIFDPFYQAQGVEGSGEGGLGLGLWIVKEIVTLHGSEICAESTPGRGSRFSFTLRLAPPAGEARP